MSTTLVPVDQRQAALRIIERIVGKELLADAAPAEGISVTTFHKVLASERELAVAYARAKEIRADLLADEALKIVDDPEIDAQRARNQMTMRQWLAAKLAPKTYGERIDLNVNQSISIEGALLEARQRVRPIRDQHDVTDVEIVEPQALPAHRPSDAESAAPLPEPAVPAETPGEPDIFS
ncbi:hypothetical protein BLA39750_02216 [Burkholderia lata]|uniref:Terminase small subunit n=1 Tax=Burkholderia lata (strain ATCC 17760 / DSM 23089 / LMG 22485 / NCIMB 9086 / R18194 / 383) TaxID=482957 RepID=A0A6P2WN28_BURL3|nr:hypothetical protein [Burkholderia lata]VWC95836.1 hypothetical protein BLA39750_02216 [Burkholderia lata]